MFPLRLGGLLALNAGTERNEMDVKDYIDETFNMINERKKLEKSKNSLNEETKRFITNLIQDHVGTKYKTGELLRTRTDQLIQREDLFA